MTADCTVSSDGPVTADCTVSSDSCDVSDIVNVISSSTDNCERTEITTTLSLCVISSSDLLTAAGSSSGVVLANEQQSTAVDMTQSISTDTECQQLSSDAAASVELSSGDVSRAVQLPLVEDGLSSGHVSHDDDDDDDDSCSACQSVASAVVQTDDLPAEELTYELINLSLIQRDRHQYSSATASAASCDSYSERDDDDDYLTQPQMSCDAAAADNNDDSNDDDDDDDDDEARGPLLKVTSSVMKGKYRLTVAYL